MTQRRWLARAAIALMLAAAAVMIGFAGLASLGMVAVGAVGACLLLANGYWFLAHRGLVRWLAFGVVILAPIAVLVIFALHHVLWVGVVSLVLVGLAIAAARLALTPVAAGQGMPAREVPPPQRAFLIMNPRSGGEKVAKFGLKQKAEALGAQVALLEGSGEVDVAALARQAVAAGADLLGVAGGDGTQALVAGIAAEHGLPFLVISAGTPQPLRDGPGAGPGQPGGLPGRAHRRRGTADRPGHHRRAHVCDNASFGAYAEIVESPAYRDDQRGTTLQMLPDILTGHRGATLTARAGETTITGPQALLVSNNPYQGGDIAGLSRRARLDTGTLGVVAAMVDNAVQAVDLLRRGRGRGVTIVTAGEAVVDADAAEIPVGIDGETVMMATPVRCAIRPRALRVRVPKNRPGTRPAKPAIDWPTLRQLASFRSVPAGT